MRIKEVCSVSEWIECMPRQEVHQAVYIDMVGGSKWRGGTCEALDTDLTGHSGRTNENMGMGITRCRGEYRGVKWES